MSFSSRPPAPAPLKILVVTHYFGNHGGGIERVAEGLIRNLAPLNDLHFSWAASDSDAAPEIPNVRVLPMRTFSFVEKILSLPWPLWSLASLRRLRRAVLAADIVWLHDTLYFGNICAFVWAKKAGKPIIVTQHIGPIPYRNPLLRFLMVGADWLLTRPMLQHATQAVFISDRVAEAYFRRIAFRMPVKIIPNSVVWRTFRALPVEARLAAREKFALRPEQPILLFVGRFVEKKGLAALRPLAALLPEYRFWLAGQGPIDPLAWDLPNVHVFEGRRDTSLAELYHVADLLIMPGYGEGFPLVIQEAMACGLPVLCSPETAAGSRIAAPHLHQTELWPNDPKRTAKVWAQKIRTFPVPLPLATPLYDSAQFAETTWDETPIAEAYAALLRNQRSRILT